MDKYAFLDEVAHAAYVGDMDAFEIVALFADDDTFSLNAIVVLLMDQFAIDLNLAVTLVMAPLV